MTSDKQRKQLCLARMIRVDGLTANSPEGWTRPIRAQHAGVDYRGCWDRNNGKLVMVFKCGEVWLGHDTLDAEVCQERWALIIDAQLERGAFVPCSNGEYIFSDHLLRRQAEPDWKS